jgi:hypothetical protein
MEIEKDHLKPKPPSKGIVEVLEKLMNSIKEHYHVVILLQGI